MQRIKISLVIQYVRRNNPSLEKFYDTKHFICDLQTNQKVKTNESSFGRKTINKYLNNENLKKFRERKTFKIKVCV